MAKRTKYRKLIICKNCGREMPHEAFGLCAACYTRKRRAENPEIREQELESKRKWHIKNREAQLKYKREKYIENREANLEYQRDKYEKFDRKRSLEYNYGITLEEYDEMLKAQDNHCAICGKTPKENGKRLAVDHNHETGEIRGLLCDTCNRGLGMFYDSPQILVKAVEYLLI